MHHRNFRHRLIKAEPCHLLTPPVQKIHRREGRQAQRLMYLMHEQIKSAGVAAFFHASCYILRQILIITGHHHRGRAHGHTMQDNLGLRIVKGNPLGPVHHIHALAIAHGQITPLTLACSSEVWRQHMVAHPQIVGCYIIGIFLRTTVAMRYNHPFFPAIILVRIKVRGL